jgi:putative transcriptional regulator
MNSLQGHFLIASPHLPDPNFFRTVVLMVQHTEEGSLGLVLNRPASAKLRAIWEKAVGEPCPSDEAVYVGGPLNGPLMAVHALDECGENEILAGVYFSTHRDQIRSVVAQLEQPYRIFSGYSGWGAGQLEGELAAGGWLTLPATREQIFAAADELWRSVTREVGEEILFSALDVKHVPDDPRMN